MRARALLALALLLPLALAGCTQGPPAPGSPRDGAAPTSYRDMGFDGTTWPRLDNVTLTILDHGAFGAFDDAAARFENRTGAKVVHVAANDAGSALHRAVQEKGEPSFDVIYGIDNILWAKALDEGVFHPYTPLLRERVAVEHVFFQAAGEWPATPVDHGYIAVNWDPRAPSLAGDELTSLDDLRHHADQFVTEDPRTSTPGLGFLLATIATYPDNASESWKDYWNDLFAGGLLVTSGWTEAYENHFSGGYGADSGGLADKALVTSYTTSPAYEAFFGRDPANLSRVLVAPNATFHQVETMGIANGTRNLAAAQAWIEFTLTDEFQSLMAPGNAVYPVVAGVDVAGTFGGHDPAPATLRPATFDAATLSHDVERWVREWVDLCEAANCA